MSFTSDERGGTGAVAKQSAFSAARITATTVDSDSDDDDDSRRAGGSRPGGSTLATAASSPPSEFAKMSGGTPVRAQRANVPSIASPASLGDDPSLSCDGSTLPASTLRKSIEATLFIGHFDGAIDLAAKAKEPILWAVGMLLGGYPRKARRTLEELIRLRVEREAQATAALKVQQRRDAQTDDNTPPTTAADGETMTRRRGSGVTEAIPATGIPELPTAVIARWYSLSVRGDPSADPSELPLEVRRFFAYDPDDAVPLPRRRGSRQQVKSEGGLQRRGSLTNAVFGASSDTDPNEASPTAPALRRVPLRPGSSPIADIRRHFCEHIEHSFLSDGLRSLNQVVWHWMMHRYRSAANAATSYMESSGDADDLLVRWIRLQCHLNLGNWSAVSDEARYFSTRKEPLSKAFGVATLSASSCTPLLLADLHVEAQFDNTLDVQFIYFVAFMSQARLRLHRGGHDLAKQTLNVIAPYRPHCRYWQEQFADLSMFAAIAGEHVKEVGNVACSPLRRAHVLISRLFSSHDLLDVAESVAEHVRGAAGTSAAVDLYFRRAAAASLNSLEPVDGNPLAGRRSSSSSSTAPLDGPATAVLIRDGRRTSSSTPSPGHAIHTDLTFVVAGISVMDVDCRAVMLLSYCSALEHYWAGRLTEAFDSLHVSSFAAEELAGTMEFCFSPASPMRVFAATVSFGLTVACMHSRGTEVVLARVRECNRLLSLYFASCPMSAICQADLFDFSGDMESAMTTAKRAAMANPRNPYCATRLVVALIQRRKDEAAVKVADQYLDIHPHCPIGRTLYLLTTLDFPTSTYAYRGLFTIRLAEGSTLVHALRTFAIACLLIVHVIFYLIFHAINFDVFGEWLLDSYGDAALYAKAICRPIDTWYPGMLGLYIFFFVFVSGPLPGGLSGQVSKDLRFVNSAGTRLRWSLRGIVYCNVAMVVVRYLSHNGNMLPEWSTHVSKVSTTGIFPRPSLSSASLIPPLAWNITILLMILSAFPFTTRYFAYASLDEPRMNILRWLVVFIMDLLFFPLAMVMHVVLVALEPLLSLWQAMAYPRKSSSSNDDSATEGSGNVPSRQPRLVRGYLKLLRLVYFMSQPSGLTETTAFYEDLAIDAAAVGSSASALITPAQQLDNRSQLLRSELQLSEAALLSMNRGDDHHTEKNQRMLNSINGMRLDVAESRAAFNGGMIGSRMVGRSIDDDESGQGMGDVPPEGAGPLRPRRGSRVSLSTLQTTSWATLAISKSGYDCTADVCAEINRHNCKQLVLFDIKDVWLPDTLQPVEASYNAAARLCGKLDPLCFSFLELRIRQLLLDRVPEVLESERGRKPSDETTLPRSLASVFSTDEVHQSQNKLIRTRSGDKEGGGDDGEKSSPGEVPSTPKNGLRVALKPVGATRSLTRLLQLPGSHQSQAAANATTSTGRGVNMDDPSWLYIRAATSEKAMLDWTTLGLDSSAKEKAGNPSISMTQRLGFTRRGTIHKSPDPARPTPSSGATATLARVSSLRDDGASPRTSSVSLATVSSGGSFASPISSVGSPHAAVVVDILQPTASSGFSRSSKAQRSFVRNPSSSPAAEASLGGQAPGGAALPSPRSGSVPPSTRDCTGAVAGGSPRPRDDDDPFASHRKGGGGGGSGAHQGTTPSSPVTGTFTRRSTIVGLGFAGTLNGNPFGPMLTSANSNLKVSPGGGGGGHNTADLPVAGDVSYTADAGDFNATQRLATAKDSVPGELLRTHSYDDLMYLMKNDQSGVDADVYHPFLMTHNAWRSRCYGPALNLSTAASSSASGLRPGSRRSSFAGPVDLDNEPYPDTGVVQLYTPPSAMESGQIDGLINGSVSVKALVDQFMRLRNQRLAMHKKGLSTERDVEQSDKLNVELCALGVKMSEELDMMGLCIDIQGKILRDNVVSFIHALFSGDAEPSSHSMIPPSVLSAAAAGGANLRRRKSMSAMNTAASTGSPHHHTDDASYETICYRLLKQCLSVFVTLALPEQALVHQWAMQSAREGRPFLLDLCLSLPGHPQMLVGKKTKELVQLAVRHPTRRIQLVGALFRHSGSLGLRERRNELRPAWQELVETLCNAKHLQFDEDTTGRLGLIYFMLTASMVCRCRVDHGASGATAAQQPQPQLGSNARVDGHTLLTKACHLGEGELVRMLVTRQVVLPADLNYSNARDYGYTPLLYAVLSNCQPAVEAIVKHPCLDDDALTAAIFGRGRQTVLQIAFESHGNPIIVSLIKQRIKERALRGDAASVTPPQPGVSPGSPNIGRRSSMRSSAAASPSDAALGRRRQSTSLSPQVTSMTSREPESFSLGEGRRQRKAQLPSPRNDAAPVTPAQSGGNATPRGGVQQDDDGGSAASSLNSSRSSLVGTPMDASPANAQSVALTPGSLTSALRDITTRSQMLRSLEHSSPNAQDPRAASRVEEETLSLGGVKLSLARRLEAQRPLTVTSSELATFLVSFMDKLVLEGDVPTGNAALMRALIFRVQPGEWYDVPRLVAEKEWLLQAARSDNASYFALFFDFTTWMDETALEVAIHESLAGRNAARCQLAMTVLGNSQAWRPLRAKLAPVFQRLFEDLLDDKAALPGESKDLRFITAEKLVCHRDVEIHVDAERDDDGHNVLSRACFNGYLDSVHFILANGRVSAKLPRNKPLADGTTPLIQAVCGNKEECVAALLGLTPTSRQITMTDDQLAGMLNYAMPDTHTTPLLVARALGRSVRMLRMLEGVENNPGPQEATMEKGDVGGSPPRRKSIRHVV